VPYQINHLSIKDTEFYKKKETALNQDSLFSY